MPKVKSSQKAPPGGWELVEPTLDELDQKMREAETEPHEGKRKVLCRLKPDRKMKKQGLRIYAGCAAFRHRTPILATKCICQVPKTKLDVGRIISSSTVAAGGSG
uniref:Uncharacterized protein n=1 Tax=Ursus americanus TaxID=9643 RepID=A0A452QGI7_URSAM